MTWGNVVVCINWKSLLPTINSLLDTHTHAHTQQTALHWAAKHGRCDIISALILNGAHVEIKSVRTFSFSQLLPVWSGDIHMCM